jgi:ribosomal protein L40E
MKLSQRLQAERAFVERSLGDSVICQKCKATLETFADACTAGLQEQCPGYLAIEQAKKDFLESNPYPIREQA